MEFTRFDELRIVVAKIGAKNFNELAEALKTKGIDATRQNVVTGDHGVYHVSKEGAVTRVLIYIVDKDVDGRFFSDDLKQLVVDRNFDSQVLIEGLHKYHFLNCHTIERAEHEGWVSKYKMSQRFDGRFFYRLLENNDVLVQQPDQVLNVCKNCVAAAKAEGLVSDDTDYSTFLPKQFFQGLMWSTHEKRLVQKGEFGEQSVPSIYAKDWSQISNRMRDSAGYQCQEVGCEYPDLSAPDMKRFLHVHHVDMVRSNNQISNLEVLCYACHAERPHHSQLKDHPDYKNFIRKRLARQ